jgi:hypothetical protein
MIIIIYFLIFERNKLFIGKYCWQMKDNIGRILYFNM